MEAGTLLSSGPDSLLRDARLLNSDIGRHSVQCNFSSRLAGRFYHNGSLERHSLRKSRLVEMQAKKRKLERELRLEERRVKLLEERLAETERAREDAHVAISAIERGISRCQAHARRRLATRSFAELRREAQAREASARFFQRRYRGWKGRMEADDRRERLRRKRRDDSAAAIQANVRRASQRRRYLDLLAERRQASERSAATIQAMLRGDAARRSYLLAIRQREHAACVTQCAWRGTLARMEAEQLRQEAERRRLEAEKPKRVPLHLRKYSTYGGGPRKHNSSKKRDLRMRRRSSDAMIIMKDGRLSSLSNLKSSASVGDPDENDSIASTITSLTNATEASGRRRAYRGGGGGGGKAPSWPTPRKVLESEGARGGGCRRHTTLQPSRRSSLERRKTFSGGLAIPPPLRRPLRRPPTLQTCDDTDSEEGSAASAGGGKVDDGVDGGSRSDTAEPASAAEQTSEAHSAPEAARATAVTVSDEASLIVQEVFGKGVMCRAIAHSSFDEEFNEHEDDLE
ncbi:hypothetical protein ACHAWF_016109 [Thalassiosira exigua]